MSPQHLCQVQTRVLQHFVVHPTVLSCTSYRIRTTPTICWRRIVDESRQRGIEQLVRNPVTAEASQPSPYESTDDRSNSREDQGPDRPAELSPSNSAAPAENLPYHLLVSLDLPLLVRRPNIIGTQTEANAKENTAGCCGVVK